MTLNQLSGALLALLFVSAWLSKAAHGFFLHHHDDHPVCNVLFEKGQHLHDERYAGADCTWCDFLLSVPEALSITVILNPPTLLLVAASPIFYSFVHTKAACDTICLRGPPAIGVV